MSDADAAMRLRIDEALAELRRKQDIRLLLAVESGSRAWGFASQDSDWDVRIMYVRPRDSYLRVHPLPETIDEPINGDLDLSGWDLRKVLALALQSNAVVLEWLTSPVVYQHEAHAHDLLLQFARETAHLPALLYHYDRLARRHWTMAARQEVRLKTLFYVIRPVLAMIWIQTRKTPPPMALDALLAGIDVPVEVKNAIYRLRAMKAMTAEGGAVPWDTAIDQFIDQNLDERAPVPRRWDRGFLSQRADTLFRALIL